MTRNSLVSYNKRTNLNYKILVLIISLIYSYILSNISMDNIVDRENYLTYANESIYILARNFLAGYLVLFSNEPLWLSLNILLSNYFEAKEVVRIIIAFSSFIVAYYVLSQDPKYFVFLLLVLLLPQVIKNHIVHLRQGLAVSIFLIAWFAEKRINRIVLFSLTPLIHVSFFFVLFFICLNWIATKIKLSINIKILLNIIIGISIGLIIGIIANMFGARQSNQYNDMASVSGLGFMYWFSFLSLLLIEGKTFLNKNIVVISMLIFYLTTYFTFEATARVFESSLILLLISGINLKNYRKLIFFILFIIYFLLQYTLKYNKPFFGWALQG